jgi:predicted deacylase
MNNKSYKDILLFVLAIGITVFPYSLSAAEDVNNQSDIITPEIPAEFNIESDKNISEEPNEPETIEDLLLETENTLTENKLDDTEQSPLTILKQIVQPGELRELNWSAGQSFSGKAVKPRVVVVRGSKPGPVLCMIAAIHGDELNGIEIIRRVIRNIDPMDVNGTVIGVPIVNIYGFTANSRYLPDRRDLNRYFPGNPTGSAASRIAHRFFTQIINHCNYVVDFHTGSFKRNNLPQLRADMNNPDVREFVSHFGSTAVLHKSGHGKSLRAAATLAGIPTVAFELGQPGSLQEEYVESGIETLDTLIGNLGILKKLRLWFEPQPIYYSSRWVRVNSGGILMSKVKIGANVKIDQLLGYIINPLTTDEIRIISPVKGRVLGMALNQFMLPGYAAFHIGVSSDSSSMIEQQQLNNHENPDDESDEVEYDTQTSEEEEMH